MPHTHPVADDPPPHGPEALSREFLRALPGVAAFVVDHDLRFLYADGEALQAARMPPESVVGKTLAEALGAGAARLEPYYRQALGGETVEFDAVAGDRVHAVRAAPIRAADGRVVAATLLSVDVTDDRRAAEQLRQSERRSRTLTDALDGVSDCVFLFDDDWRFVYVSRSADRFLGGRLAAGPADALVGQMLWDAFPNLVDSPVARQLRDARATGQAASLEFFSGALDAWLTLTAKPVPGGLLVWLGDVTALRRSEARLERIAANVPGMVFQFRLAPDGTPAFTFVSDGARDIYGLEPEAIRADAQLILEIVHPDDRASFAASIGQSQETLEPWRWEGRVVLGDGTLRWLQAVSRPERGADGSTVWDGLLLDATRARRAEETIRWQAFHDPLTGLPNRTSYLERLEQALRHARGKGGHVGVLFLDLDRFKDVNDTLGHAIGDEVLRAAAERVGACLAPGDTVARLGGDELTVLLPDQPSAEAAACVGRRIVAAFAEPLVAAGRSVALTCSVGLAVAPTDGVDAALLLVRADTAMYQAKEQGRGRLELFDERLARRLRTRMSRSGALRQALDRGEFTLAYQPQLDTRSRTYGSVEALLRWHRASGESVPPDAFIPLAEELGLIGAIGGWVLRTACSQAAAWAAAGTPRRVSVNVSAHQLRDGTLPGVVSEALAQSRLPPQLLELELTESALIAQGDRAIEQLERLRAVGVRISLDDFGTGYSSLAYLRRLPLDAVKLDRSLVPDSDDEAGVALVRGVVDLCHALTLDVVAEGIETAGHQRLLSSLGCDLLQGYHIGRPAIPVDASGRHAA